MRICHHLPGEFRDGIGLDKVAVGWVGDVGKANLPARPYDGGGIKDRPHRSGLKVRRLLSSIASAASVADDLLYWALICAVLALRQSVALKGRRVPSVPGGYLGLPISLSGICVSL